jgi:hypothetical protein
MKRPLRLAALAAVLASTWLMPPAGAYPHCLHLKGNSCDPATQGETVCDWGEYLGSCVCGGTPAKWRCCCIVPPPDL